MTTTTEHHGPELATPTFPDVDEREPYVAPDVDEDEAPYDPLAALTVDELSTGSRQLRASLVRAVTQVTEDYERALAVVLWLHRRREQAGVVLAPFLRLTFVELQAQLSELGAGGADPTTPAPAR